MRSQQEIAVRVASRDVLAEDIIGLALEAVDAAPLPSWTPGAHIGVYLPLAGPDGEQVIRQYSLCGCVEDRRQYRIAVLREAAGRGGSAFIHDTLAVGDVVTISPPRNHFPFEPAARCLFIAGGIGITPILPMVREAQIRQLDWHLHYSARYPARMAYRDELAALDPERVRLHCDERNGRFDLDAILAGSGRETVVYSCGPSGLLDALKERSDGAEWALRMERFANAAAVEPAGDSFEIICASSGQRLVVPPDKSILTVLREAGYRVKSACKDGICGTCETRVLRGIPDHRDAVLTEQEKASNEYMMVCVSRAKTPELELDV